MKTLDKQAVCLDIPTKKNYYLAFIWYQTMQKGKTKENRQILVEIKYPIVSPGAF